jgi:RimJ/RimL family protein N-acetyltransferase
MNERPLLQGELVRLAPLEPEEFAEAYQRWSTDSEYLRLEDTDTATPTLMSRIKEHFEERDLSPLNYDFAIRTLNGDRLIGTVGLFEIDLASQQCWVGIGIGEREFWGQGFGTDAMREVLRYGFVELNLRRISLDVFGYNQRGYKSYLKAGFTEEGRIRDYLNRGRRRWDLIYMGILREEWEARQAPV